MPLAEGPPIDNDGSSSFLQDLHMEIHKDKRFTSDVDLYFNTLVVDWHGS